MQPLRSVERSNFDKGRYKLTKLIKKSGGKEANAVTKVCEYATSCYHFQNNIDVCFTFSIKLLSMSEIIN